MSHMSKVRVTNRKGISCSRSLLKLEFNLQISPVFCVMGILLNFVGAQGNGECEKAVQQLNSSCAVKTIDDLASMHRDQISNCCNVADILLQFECFDLCDTNSTEDISEVYGVWRPLCNHPTPLCSPVQNQRVEKSGNEYYDTVFLGGIQHQVGYSNQEHTFIMPVNQTEVAAVIQQQLQMVVENQDNITQYNLYTTQQQRTPTSFNSSPSPVTAPSTILTEIFQKMSQDPELSTSIQLFSQNPSIINQIEGGSSLTLLLPTNSAWLVFAIKIGLSLPQELHRFQYIQKVLQTHMVWGKHQLSSIKKSDTVQLLTLKQDLVLRVYWNQKNELLVEGCCEDGNHAVIQQTDAYEDLQVQVHVTEDVLLPPSAFQEHDAFFSGNLGMGPVSALSLISQEQNQSTVNLDDYLQKQFFVDSNQNDYYQVYSSQVEQNTSQQTEDWTTSLSKEIGEDWISPEDSNICRPISQVVEEEVCMGSFFTILKHAQLVDELSEIPMHYGEYSLLAPTNEALESMTEVFQQELTDQQKLEFILSYQIIPTPIEQQIQQLGIGRSITFDTILKSSSEALQLQFRKYSNFTVVTGISGSAILQEEKLQACNATIYFLDTVIVPFERRTLK